MRCASSPAEYQTSIQEKLPLIIGSSAAGLVFLIAVVVIAIVCNRWVVSPAWTRPGFREGCPSILPSLNRVYDQRGQEGLGEARRPPSGLPPPKRPQLAVHPFGQVLPWTSPRSTEVAY